MLHHRKILWYHRRSPISESHVIVHQYWNLRVLRTLRLPGPVSVTLYKYPGPCWGACRDPSRTVRVRRESPGSEAQPASSAWVSVTDRWQAQTAWGSDAHSSGGCRGAIRVNGGRAPSQAKAKGCLAPWPTLAPAQVDATGRGGLPWALLVGPGGPGPGRPGSSTVTVLQLGLDSCGESCRWVPVTWTSALAGPGLLESGPWLWQLPSHWVKSRLMSRPIPAGRDRRPVLVHAGQYSYQTSSGHCHRQ
jgi:hypothetical protein